MIVGVLQARYSSTRLPGKVLKNILGRPMLQLQMERLTRSRRIDGFIVATSDQPDDDVIADFCRKQGISCSRGSLSDVLDRYYRAVEEVDCHAVVRLTGDCPLADPSVVDAAIDFFTGGDYDYASNTINPTWPDGLDVEVMGKQALQTAWREAVLPSEREHVTPYIYNHPELFRLGSFENAVDLSAMRWTVDEVRDYELVREVYEVLYNDNPFFSTQNILDLLRRRPQLANLNTGISRNEGYQQSLQSDRQTETE